MHIRATFPLCSVKGKICRNWCCTVAACLIGWNSRNSALAGVVHQLLQQPAGSSRAARCRGSTCGAAACPCGSPLFSRSLASSFSVRSRRSAAARAACASGVLPENRSCIRLTVRQRDLRRSSCRALRLLADVVAAPPCGCGSRGRSASSSFGGDRPGRSAPSAPAGVYTTPSSALSW